MPPASEYFIGAVNGELVCHVVVAPMFQNHCYRATRLVVMPEWQGAGVGTKFLEWVCEYHAQGNGRCGKKYPTLFHTSHPQLIGYFNRSSKWVLKSQQMFGGNKAKSTKSIKRAQDRREMNKSSVDSGSNVIHTIGGFGGHFRAVQGFKYIGNYRRAK